MEKSIRTLEELEAEAARFVADLAPSSAGRLPAGRQATLITLSGELGAGKTAFTKSVAKALGVEAVVNSPTFVIENIYQLPAPQSGAGFARLIHIDAYRLESGHELAALGFDELLRDPSNLILLEWPEMVADALPPPAVALTLVAHDDGSRTISYENKN